MKLSVLVAVAAANLAATAVATELEVIERMMRTGTHTCLDSEGKWPGDNYRTAEDCAKLDGGQWVERQTQEDFDASVKTELAGLRAAFADEKKQFVQALIRVRQVTLVRFECVRLHKLTCQMTDRTTLCRLQQ